MMIPSVVRTERSALRRSERRADPGGPREELGRARAGRRGGRSRAGLGAAPVVGGDVPPASVALVVDHEAVADPDDPAGVGGDRRVVGHQDDRQAVLGVELLEEAEDLLAGLRVEVAGRLVGDQQVEQRLISARAIATRCCSPPESCAGSWSSRSPRPTRSSSACARSRPSRPRRASPRVGQRHHHVLQGREPGQQVEVLEDEPDLLGSAGAPARRPRARETSSPSSV